MPSHAARSSPITISPVKTLQQDAFRDSGSPSRGSVDRSNRDRGGAGSQWGTNQAVGRSFLEDVSPVENGGDPADVDDPHDLSFSPQHIPRASMVDSLVMSLDQFSNEYGHASYQASSGSASQYRAVHVSRNRGHTLSSSISSEGDVRQDRSWFPALTSNSRLNRRHSKPNFPRPQLPSIFADEEDTARAKVYDAQRAARPSKAPTVKHKKSKASKDSTNSSLDLSHLHRLSGRLGPAGNRRSRSFDFGSRRPPDFLSVRDTIEVAPAPAVFSGPEAQKSPIKESFNTLPIGRRSSTKSSKSAYVKKPKTGTLGTTTIRGLGGEPGPPVPSIKSAGALYGAVGESRINLTDSTPLPRPGFFRRVFGSSRHTTPTEAAVSSSHASGHGRGTPITEEASHANPAPPTKPPPAPAVAAEDAAVRESPATITKKSSVFFRRRKKSVSSGAAPPLPLTLGADAVQAAQLSPVGSLRALMEPYLADAPPHGPSSSTLSDDAVGYHTAHSTPTVASGSFLAPVNLKGDHAFHDPKADQRPKLQIPDSKTSSMLRVPHQGSFLADSSSTEEQSKNSFRTSPTSEWPAAGSLTRSPAESLARLSSHHSSTQLDVSRPDVARSSSWPHDRSPLPSPRPSTITPTSSKPKPTLSLAVATDRSRTQTKVSSPSSAKESTANSASEASLYRSAPSTPMDLEQARKENPRSPIVHVSHPSISAVPAETDAIRARRIYDNLDEDVDAVGASAWLGEAGSDREGVRKAYMELFDWSGLNILAAMRSLCDRIALKCETQQMDRILDAFAQRWCECNSNHGFKSDDVVHTICYSLLLLNTDLHLADIGQKMTRAQFVRNALPTIKRVAQDNEANDSLRAPSPSVRSPPATGTPRRMSLEHDSSGPLANPRPVERLAREDSGDFDGVLGTGGPLVDAPFVGSEKGWEAQIESILKSFYMSISRQRLPLFGAALEPSMPPVSQGLLAMTGNMLRRTPSVLSKAQFDTRGRLGGDGRSLGTRWVVKTRSRPRIAAVSGFGSSRTSLDEGSSIGWSPSMSSTWSKASLGKTLTSTSMDSLGSEATKPDYQSSIGFANALSLAIIRDDQMDLPADEGMRTDTLLEDETLGLCGAPWAKEGMLKHKCHLDGADKRSKDRNWNDCFAVIEKGWMRLFSFSVNAKSVRQKTKAQKATGVVGGGNWQDNAEEVWKFMLRHTIASSLPPPGYSKARPYVWALSLPNGAVHLFSVGTPDIVKEFVSTANYWSARLSKEPMMGGVSNMEYGWSDAVINRALIGPEPAHGPNRLTPSPRPSTQMSIRSSVDYGTGLVRPKLSGDKAHINDWLPPQQSMMASTLMEVDQLRGLQTYVTNVENDLAKHNELRGPMLLAFSARHPNATKAMNNWEKKSSYLLREIVKFRTYIDILGNAQASKERVYRMRTEAEETRRAEDDPKALTAAMNALR